MSDASNPEGGTPLPVIDQLLLDETTGGDREFEKELLISFRDSLRPQADAVLASLDQDDLAITRRASHLLRGAAGNVGATALMNVCERMETASHEKNQSALASLRGAFADEVERAMCELEKLP